MKRFPLVILVIAACGVATGYWASPGTGSLLAAAYTPSLGALAEMGGPEGTWYLNAGGLRLTLVLSPGPIPGTFQGTLGEEDEPSNTLDEVGWDASTKTLEFRRRTRDAWEWYRGAIVEGIFVGRFSHDECALRPARHGVPAQMTSYLGHVTGWNATVLDTDRVPRVYEVLLNRQYRGQLRIDRAREAPGRYLGRLKVYSTVLGDASGEEPEYDLESVEWDGANLSFVRRSPGWTETFKGVASGRTISGTYTHGDSATPLPWEGYRAEVLGYGLVPKSAEDRKAWQEHTRQRLYHLMMADNPMPLTRRVTVMRSQLSPFPSARFAPNRDDNPAAWPQNYTLSELRFDYTLPNPYSDAAVARTSHAYLAVPTGKPPAAGRFPAVLAVNGHGGSAWRMMNPDDEYFWYGDSFARRGFVVLALDISHRDGGDDPPHGNGPHPPIRALGFDTDWEEDGERAWDAMRALDYLLSLPEVDPTQVVVTGISLGGEVTTITAALDPRPSMAIPAGYSPDLGVMIYHGNHECWQWDHADLREYVGLSDFHALIAPRLLVVETGRHDDVFSDFHPPFAADKQVARRSHVAYQPEVQNFIHYLHYDVHHFHVADVNPTRPSEQGLRQPVTIEPEIPGSLAWQMDGHTRTDGRTLFDLIAEFLKLTPGSTSPGSK